MGFGTYPEVSLAQARKKAWSQNLGHAGVLTTLYSYGDVPDYRQAELIKKLSQPREIVSDEMEAMVLATMQKMMGSPKT